MVEIDSNCDFSPMKEQIKTHLHEIIDGLHSIIRQMDNDETCMLNSLEQIQHSFSRIQATAGTFYLNCFLSPFTSKFNELSIALQHLSENKIGALIVVERNEPVEGLIRHGISIGAPVSNALLEAIFYPGNPLHDGAVWIQGDRIMAAAGVLPLSASLVDKQKFGTRHRAALGMSERSDAIVLIVSEESGSASLCTGGHMYPIILH